MGGVPEARPGSSFRKRHCTERAPRRPAPLAMTAQPPYDPLLASSYWSHARHARGDELAAVLSLGEPRAVDEAYDAWETGLLRRALEGRLFRSGLDLGTGVGRVALRMRRGVTRLTVADLAPGMLERTRANARAAAVGNLDPVRLRSDRLPFAEGAFDLVTCLGLLEHLPPESRRATLAECARVLIPGGLLALVLNNESSRLLRDPSDNPLRLARQEASGYYCAIVGQEILARETKAHFE